MLVLTLTFGWSHEFVKISRTAGISILRSAHQASLPTAANWSRVEPEADAIQKAWGFFGPHGHRRSRQGGNGKGRGPKTDVVRQCQLAVAVVRPGAVSRGRCASWVMDYAKGTFFNENQQQ